MRALMRKENKRIYRHIFVENDSDLTYCFAIERNFKNFSEFFCCFDKAFQPESKSAKLFWEA